MPGAHEHHRELRELRRLHRHRARGESTVASRHPPDPTQRDREHQEQHDQVDEVRVPLEPAVVEAEHREHDDGPAAKHAVSWRIAMGAGESVPGV
jgi:hypothetical protein